MISILMFAFYSFLKLLDHWAYGHSYWNPVVLGFIAFCFILEVAFCIAVFYYRNYEPEQKDYDDEEDDYGFKN